MGMNELMSGSSSKSNINRYLGNKEEGMKLLAQLVSTSSNQNNVIEKEVRELKVMLMDCFLELTKTDKCPGSAEVYSDLQKAYEDMIEIINFPQIENKFTIAVGGQFSSGKSKFLNKLLGVKKLLPEDTSATTSIPTYIIKGKEDTVFALNNFQSKTKIDNEALHAISHAFKSTYDLSFSHILKMIIVERKNFMWKNISFLDTPGYSKSDSVKSRHDNTDENIAREHLRGADYLIWLTDIQNGTIPEEDIQFINSLQFDEPILIVLNKADKKTDAQIKTVIKVAKENLEKNEIKFFDVIGFSALRNKEYSEKGNILPAFIENINSKRAGTSIIKRFEDIFNDYLCYHKTEVEFLRFSRKIVTDAFSEAYKEDLDSGKLKKLTKKQQKHIKTITASEKEFEGLKMRTINSIKAIFHELGIREIEGYRAKKQRTGAKLKKILYKFDAMVQITDEQTFSLLNSFNEIPGKIARISSVGVSIEILVDSKNVGEVLITNAKVKKQINEDIEDFFEIDELVSIKLTGEKKAIVKIIKGAVYE